MSFSIHQRLCQDKYIIEQELGRGGFGITYKATNTVLNQVVVIKTLNDALRQDSNFLNHQQQFHAEARRLAKCIHPSIVRVSDFFTDNGLPCIVMDYVPGPTLDTLVSPDSPLPEAMALDYIQQVGDAVKTIHHNGLLHRDIKPQNLILREGTQQVVLIDFGIAREFTPGQTQTHTHLVSEGYAPIEQYLPQAQRSSATDVYGLAATLYTLLTGKVPIAAPLRDRCPLPEPHQLRPEVSASVNQAVMQGMAMEPVHRPATVDAWLALLPNVEHRSFTVPPPGGSPKSQVATVVVAPAFRPAPHQPTQAAAATAASVPAQQQDTAQGRWRWPVAIFALLLPLGLGYAWWRSQVPSTAPPNTSDPLIPSAPTETTPTPVETETPTAPGEDTETTPTPVETETPAAPGEDTETTPTPGEDTETTPAPVEDSASPPEPPPLPADTPREPPPPEPPAPDTPSAPEDAPTEDSVSPADNPNPQSSEQGQADQQPAEQEPEAAGE